MTNVQKHMAMLGKRAEDKVTGMKGVVTSISFDLYGCVQSILNPGLDKDRKLKEMHYFDVSRLKILSEKPVMTPPNYDYGKQAEGKQGASEKPTYFKS